MDWTNVLFNYGLPAGMCFYFIASNTKREIRMEQTAQANTKAVQDIAIAATSAIAECTSEMRKLSEKVDALTVERRK